MNVKAMHDVMQLANEFERIAVLIAKERRPTGILDTALYIESMQQWVVVLVLNGGRYREIVSNDEILKAFK
ncbi:hypothetical protein VPHF86_0196 [Vibrio phage F86]